MIAITNRKSCKYGAKARWLVGFGIIIAGLGLVYWQGIKPAGAQDASISDEETRSILELNEQIAQKRQAIDELEKKTRVFEETINRKQSETVNLENQLEQLEVNIEQTANDTEKTKIEIEKFTLEIRQVEGTIAKRNEEIKSVKDSISEFVRIIYRNANRTTLEITLLDNTFSRYFMRAKAARDIEGEMKKGLDRLQVLKTELERQRSELEVKKKELDEAKTRLEANLLAQEQEKSYKEQLQSVAEQEASRYQDMLDEVANEVNRATSEVGVLEDRFRKKISEQNINLEELLANQGEFIWPVTPARGISAYFHDPDYPYRRYFEHSAIDIPAAQGTPVKSTADGIVSIVRDTGWTLDRFGRKIPAYNYVSIIHGESISSVYGHLSAINVSPEQYVRKGEVIGYSGGAPGTTGAGLLTTGAHLHFEIREGGIPVDPLGYLK